MATDFAEIKERYDSGHIDVYEMTYLKYVKLIKETCGLSYFPEYYKRITDRLKNKTCANCGSSNHEFRDEYQRKRFEKLAFCQKCLDIVDE